MNQSCRTLRYSKIGKSKWGLSLTKARWARATPFSTLRTSNRVKTSVVLQEKNLNIKKMINKQCYFSSRCIKIMFLETLRVKSSESNPSSSPVTLKAPRRLNSRILTNLRTLTMPCLYHTPVAPLLTLKPRLSSIKWAPSSTHSLGSRRNTETIRLVGR